MGNVVLLIEGIEDTGGDGVGKGVEAVVKGSGEIVKRGLTEGE